ncbi:hypothetical protein WJX75_005542 [Coccomyxa subellipsoidea]|uniref:Acyltransferase 3 domain-containing protein n=1 Tax=Coccomyxa subellipsoidea TaxID=248742 RepID=A0ABR2YL18_9CHLO
MCVQHRRKWLHQSQNIEETCTQGKNIERTRFLVQGELAALTGVRALACLSIVLGHSMFALGFAWPERHLEWYAALDAHTWMLALVNLSEPVMDTFLILTGFLAAHSLGSAFQHGKAPRQVVGSYLRRRLLRIAVQAQFYLGFPVLLLLLRPAVRGLFRRMAVTAVIVIAAVTAYRAVIALQFELPVPVFGPLDDPRMLELMTRTLRLSYYSLLPRLTHLSFGVLGACSIRSKVVRGILVKRRTLANVSAALAAALVAATLFGNRFGPAPDKAHLLASPAALVIGVAGITGLLQPAALTYLIIHLALNVSETLSGCLSWRGWRPFADSSYDVYLLHPMVMFGVWSVLAPGTWFDLQNPSPLPFLGVCAVVFGVSFVLARVHSRAWGWMLRRTLLA